MPCRKPPSRAPQDFQRRVIGDSAAEGEAAEDGDGHGGQEDGGEETVMGPVVYGVLEGLIRMCQNHFRVHTKAD